MMIEFGIEKYTMIIRKRRKGPKRKEKTAESRKNQKTWRKGKSQVLGNIGSGYHQIREDENNNNKRAPQINEKSFGN